MSDRVRTALAFLLIIAILFVWSIFNRSRKPQTIPSSADTLTRDTLVSDTSKLSIDYPLEPQPIISSGDTIVVDRAKFRLVLSSHGGSVQSFYVKRYDVDLVPPNRLLFATRLGSAAEIIDFDYKVFNDSLCFFYHRGGREIRKVYIFDKEFGFGLTSRMAGAESQVLDLRSGLNTTEPRNLGEDLRHFGVYLKNKKVDNITRKIKDRYEYNGDFDWFGLRTKYFFLAVDKIAGAERLSFYKIAKENEKTAGVVKDVDIAVFGCPYYMRGGGNRYGAEIYGSETISISVLLLPIKYSQLASFKRGYEGIASGGIWGPIARLILALFNLLFALIKNYGFVVILFAVFIKAIFFPLSRQMIISQHKMQLLQPELKKIQQRYKDDPQKLNQEMMHLYKIYKVNPFSGCLPLLIQMPIFFALYQTLITSIEFRQASFIFWLTDLSMKDPYYVLPIGMGVMMLIQSLTTTVDPRQKYMVLFMPIFLVFIFLNLPSGLQLYWFTYNILTLVEHYLIRRGGMK